MSRALLCLSAALCLSLGCGGERSPSTSETVRPASASASSQPEQSRHPRWCGTTLVEPTVPEPPCRNEVEAEVAASVTSDILSVYRAATGSSVSVGFACERLSKDVREIVVEEGSGHGWGITLTRLERQSDGSFAVRKFGFDGNFNANDPQTFETAEKLTVSLEKAHVDASVLLPLLPRVRASLLASIEDPNPLRFHSSASFVAGVVLTDDRGATLERWSAAYEDGEAQGEYTSPRVAIQVIAKVLAQTRREAVDLTDADRAFFGRRFRAAVARFKSRGFPLWTRQAYTGMATWAGGPDIVRSLFTLADDEIEERTRYLAVNALTSISRIDLRRDETQRERPLLEVEQRYRRECE